MFYTVTLNFAWHIKWRKSFELKRIRSEPLQDLPEAMVLSSLKIFLSFSSWWTEQCEVKQIFFTFASNSSWKRLFSPWWAIIRQMTKISIKIEQRLVENSQELGKILLDRLDITEKAHGVQNCFSPFKVSEKSGFHRFCSLGHWIPYTIRELVWISINSLSSAMNHEERFLKKIG